MFKTTKLAGHRVLVQGSEPNQTTVLDSSEWDEVGAILASTYAVEQYDTAIERFFLPITHAANKLDAVLAKATGPADSRSQVIINRGVEAVEGVEPEIIELGRDATILRMIENGHTEQLLWVGDTIELLHLEEGEPEDEGPVMSGTIRIDSLDGTDLLSALFGLVDEPEDTVDEGEPEDNEPQPES